MAPTARVIDEERRAAVVVLRHHTAAGRLTLDEFSERAGTVFAAQTAAEVDAVFVDLPALAAQPDACLVLSPEWQRRGWH